MQLRLARTLVDVSLVLVALIAGSVSARVSAHAAPAFPPVFDPGPCVQVVHRAQQSSVRIGYRVPQDDTLLTAGDIPLPDALTHQFFALRGTVLFEGFAPEIRTFAADAPDAVVLPLWISLADVMRAQQSSDTHTLGYDLSPITPQDVLETKTTLTSRWVRITPDDRRVPITSDQSLSGITWNVRDVEPGLYTIGAYIFSPPYNGWEIREELVSVVDGEEVPAAVVGRIQESLFAGQGRKVNTCLEVPPGTRMRSYLQIAEREDLGWIAWDEERPVNSGTLEQCFHPPDGLTGTVRLRVDLISAEGSATTFYSPDTLTVIAGSLACTEGESICCAADGGPSDVTEPIAKDAGANDAAAAESEPEDSAGGCSVAIHDAGWDRAALALGCLGALVLRRGRRLSRPEPTARPNAD